MNAVVSLMTCVLFTCYFSVQTISANVENYMITTFESFQVFALSLSEFFFKQFEKSSVIHPKILFSVYLF